MSGYEIPRISKRSRLYVNMGMGVAYISILLIQQLMKS